PSPVTYCQSATAAPLTATAGSTTDTLLWYTVATGGTGSKTAPTPSTAAAGSKFYYVSAKTLMGCEGKRDTIEVIVKAAATPVVSSPVNYCQGAAAVPLTATKGSTTDTLYWYTSATAVTGSKTAPTPSTAAAGTSSYYVSVRTTANCESPRAKIDVQVNAPASQPVAASPLNLCQGATAAALTATKGSSTDTLFWYTSPTGGTGSKTAPTPSTASTGTSSYYVSAKSNKGCEGTRDTIDVIVNPVPAVPTVSTPVVYCQNATASALTAGRGSASDTLFWYTAATGGTGSKTAPTPSTASTGTSSRYVSAKNTFGCESNRAKIDITINPKGATPGVTSPVHYCRGDAPMPLTATAGSSSDTLYWYTAASGGTGTKAAPTPSTATAGTTKYYVSARTSLGCEGDRATIEVQVHPPADTPGVSTPLVYCRNDKAFALSASMVLSSDTLLWYTSATGGTPSRTAPIPSTATDGTTYYYVSAKSSFGCEGGRDTIAVVVNPLPVVSVSSLSPTGTIRCRNIDSIVLKATAPTALSYQWYYEVTPQPGATRDTVHARASGYWYAVVTDAKGCRGKDSLWVQRDTLEEPVLTPPDNKICIGGSVLLTCSPGYVVNRFRWYRNGILLPAIPVTRSITSVSDTGSYTVSMTNAAGCTYKTNTARVEYYPPTPKPKLVYTPPVLSVSGGSYRAYQWYQDMKWLFGATGSTYTVTDEGDYYVEVTDVNGCTSKSDTLYIQPPTSLGPQYATLQLKLYPNPTSSVVRIDAPIKVNVMVTDLSGKPVLPVQEAQTVDLKDLADGSYFFRITDEHGQLLGTEKIQKISR
ncbi:MAG: T9SS type A sorting domain-containing protein, partial [Chitinophagaceae bacterium]|nr:T9SS type A sorting domain-containing protein [Chitinophagaceae bacterium]